jgi:hypothetical protein
LPLEQPQRDENGQVIPYDCDGIEGADGIIRRISDQFIVPDGKGGRRISSMAFKKSSGANAGMSIDIEKLIVEAGLSPREFVTAPKWMGSVRFTAQALRDEVLLVGFDPLEDNPYHGEVWGSFTSAKAKRLQRMAEWYVAIDGVQLNEAS